MDVIINPDYVWINNLNHVINYGMMSSPRGKKVYECLCFSSVVGMRNPIIRHPLRKLGYKFMAAEAAWILSGDDRVSSISPYSKHISDFSDDGETFFGAYGPKVYAQLPYVVEVLAMDQDSRQAVINIWRENPPASKDIPCTLSLQFLIRGGELHCVATMRSSDLWLGHPYDTFNFSAISFAVLLELRNLWDVRVELGRLYLTAGSKHIYETNLEAVGEILSGVKEYPQSKGTPFVADRYGDSEDFITDLWNAAKSEAGALSLLEE